MRNGSTFKLRPQGYCYVFIAAVSVLGQRPSISGTATFSVPDEPNWQPQIKPIAWGCTVSGNQNDLSPVVMPHYVRRKCPIRASWTRKSRRMQMSVNYSIRADSRWTPGWKTRLMSFEQTTPAIHHHSVHLNCYKWIIWRWHVNCDGGDNKTRTGQSDRVSRQEV